MTTPIKEQIAAAILTQLQTVTAPAYNTTLTSVTRATRTGDDWTPEHLAVRLDQGDAVPLEGPGGAINYITWQQTFVASVYGAASDASTVAADIALNMAEADIQKAIMATPQWGGLAIDTALGPVPAFEAEDGSFVTRLISFTVTFRVKDTDPYSQ